MRRRPLRYSPPSDVPLVLAWYGRLSTDELQQPQLAFPSQKAACEKRIQGLGRIVSEFTDIQSGRSDDRAGIESLLDEASRPDRRFDAVVTYKVERFARRMVLALAYEEELRRAGVPIYVSDEAGEPGRPTSVLTRRIKQAVGEWYVLELVEESQRGMKENTRQGFNTGGAAPYGYRKRLLPNPSRTMAERADTKCSWSLIPSGLPPWRGSSPSSCSVTRHPRHRRRSQPGGPPFASRRWVEGELHLVDPRQS